MPAEGEQIAKHFSNQALFSDHYLAERMDAHPEWTEDIGDAFAQLLGLYQAKQDILDGLNEAQTEEEERRTLVEDVVERYLAYLEHGEDVMVLAFVAARLDVEPEEADVVHDLLAYLAKQMIEMHKEKQAEANGLLDWLADYTGLPIDDWKLKTYVRAYWEHPWSELQRALSQNRKRMGRDVEGREAQGKIKREFEDSTTKLKPLLAHIEATDRLIDRIVYRLYGLTDEEIAVVEGQDR